LRRSDTMRSAPHSRPLSLHDALPISAEDTIHQKEGPANFVTDFDTEIQKFLISGLKKILPEAEFFGEEDTEENKGASASGEYTFYIDPIDGTTNFMFRYNHSCVYVGLARREKMIAIGREIVLTTVSID